MHRIKKIHPAAHGGLPKKLATEWKKVREEIEFKDEDASISKIELAQKIESIFSLLNDAHTNITFSFVDARYLKHAYTHIQAKDELISVNGKSKRDIFLENRNLFSTENDEYAISRIGNYITSLEGLAYLNIEPEDGAFNYEFQHIDGSTETFAYPISDFVSYDEYLSLNYAGNNEEENEEAPKQQSFVHYETDVKNSIATLTLDTCTFNDVYKETLRSFFDEVKTNKIRNLIVDLRNNGGGNSLVANEFMRYLAVNQYKEASSDLRMGPFTSHSAPDVIQNDKYEGYNFDGQIYVLTSVQTFSSAMMFAMYIKDNNLGQVVGEASGNNPSSYGDVVCFRLPESRLYMQVSWKKWYRIDESKDGELIEPDIPVKADDALSTVIELIVGPTIPEPEFVDYLGLDYQNPDELNAENLEGTEPATN